MGNINSNINSCNDDEYYNLYKKIDKMSNQIEIYKIEKKTYLKTITDFEKRLADNRFNNDLLKKENDFLKNNIDDLNNEICKYKENEKKNVKEKVFLSLKNNDLHIKNTELKNQIINNELEIFNYDLNYKYIKYILKQTNKLNLKLQNDLIEQYVLNTKYLKLSIFTNMLNNYIKYNNSKKIDKVKFDKELLIKDKELLIKNNELLIINKNNINNVFDFYIENKDKIIKNLLLSNNTLIPDYFEEKIIKNVYNKIFEKLKYDLQILN